jgi:hypothetical protein
MISYPLDFYEKLRFSKDSTSQKYFLSKNKYQVWHHGSKQDPREIPRMQLSGASEIC